MAQAVATSSASSLPLSLRSAPGRGSPSGRVRDYPPRNAAWSDRRSSLPPHTVRAISSSLLPASAANRIWARLSLRAASLAPAQHRSQLIAFGLAQFGRVEVWRGGFRSNISVSASFVWRCLSGSTMTLVSTPRSSNRTCRFPASGSRTRTSRLRPRHVAPKRAQAYEPEVPVKVREWIGPALASPDLVLDAQPPAQPHRCVAVERPIRFADGAYLEVVRPSAQRAVQFCHQLCGVLPSPRSGGQLVWTPRP